jgi:hypothetical protein
VPSYIVLGLSQLAVLRVCGFISLLGLDGPQVKLEKI